MAEDRIEQEELRGRVIYATFLPAVRMAANASVPLSQMKKWVEMAYYHETRRRGLSMKDAMTTMGLSISKAALLSRQLKENFAQPEDEHDLPRRIEYALWAEPLTLKRLSQHLKGVSDEEIGAALKRLIKEKRIAGDNKRKDRRQYRLLTKEGRRVWNTWLARLDGLNRALGAVSDSVYSRFFRTELPAFARTITLHVRREDLDLLQGFYEEHFYPFLAELDGKASGRPSEDVETIVVNLVWARSGASVDDEKDDPA